MNIDENRQSRKYAPGELIGRVLWGCFTPFFRWSPRLCWGWRRFLLRLFGAKIGAQVHIDPSARVFLPWNLEIGDWSSVGFDALLYNLGPLKIGERVTISQRAHLCGGTHKFREASMPLVRARIEIGDEAWVCADSFIGPGVSVGAKAVVGARAVAMRNVHEGKIVTGNPAREVGNR
ncbi:MAG: putative colanic acid biosynthesis acetyltransferase [Verrucomicrobiota bacterium]